MGERWELGGGTREVGRWSWEVSDKRYYLGGTSYELGGRS